MIRVVNCRGLNRPDQRSPIVYCGRAHAGWKGHKLANPFKPGESDVSTCLDSYRAWLLARPTLEADLTALWIETGRGTRALGCWCVNATHGDGQAVVCHAQILAEMLADRFLQGLMPPKEIA